MYPANAHVLEEVNVQPDLKNVRKWRVEDQTRNMEFLAKKLKVITPYTTTFNFYLECYEEAARDILYQQAYIQYEATL